MKQTLVYGQQSCRLQLEGFPDVSAGHAPDALGIITSWTLDWAGRPPLEGQRDHLAALINVVLPYARYLMSGVSRPFGTAPQPVEISPAGPGQHRLVLRSSQPGVSPLEVHLDDAELADLVRVLDSLRLDPRLHLQPPLSQPVVQPLRRRELRQAEPLAQRLAAPLGGLAVVALTAGLSSLAPLPAPAPFRAASPGAPPVPGAPGPTAERAAPPRPPATGDPGKPDPGPPKTAPSAVSLPNRAEPTSPPAPSPNSLVPQPSRSQPPGNPRVGATVTAPVTAPVAPVTAPAAPAAAPAPRPLFSPPSASGPGTRP